MSFAPGFPFGLEKIMTDPHTLADVNAGYPDDRYPKLVTYMSELILDGH